MTRRTPVLAALLVVVGAAVVASEGGDETPTVRSGDAQPGVHMPAAPPGDVVASTWYCAAGTAGAGGFADHTVVVFNPGDEPVDGTITVYAGALDRRTPDEEADGASDDQEGSEARGQERSSDDTSDDTSADDAERSSDETSDDTSGDDAGAGAGGGGGGIIGSPWEGSGGEAPAPVVDDLSLPPGGRVDVRLADLIDAPLAAALVEAAGPVVVEHQVEGPKGRDVGACASTAAPEWHLAWGATTRDARELLVLFNPFPSAATVDIVLTTDDGIRQPVRYQGLPVPGGGVVGLDVGDDVTRKEQVALSVRTRSGSIVVEQLQQFDGSGRHETRGLAVVLAVPQPLEAWGFATGRLGGGRREQIVVYNPTDERAEVDVSVRPSGGDGREPPPPFGLTIRAGGYEVIDYGEDERVPRDVGHATVVRSRNGVPVVAERVLSFPGSAGDIAAGTGATFADRSWLFATRGSDDDAVAFLVAYNPDRDRPARVSATGYVDGEAVAPDELQDVEVPPGGRAELRFEGDLDTGDLAAVIDSDLPIVVERSLENADGGGQAVGPGILGDEEAVPLADVDVALEPR
ncbi:MAG TPA: DUF5719 family protein [Acidimicrobiales bacterium]|nr:DUF5719 family protein [Acidimicrobiales bacterium]